MAMADTKARAVAESVFDRNQRRETQISEALKQEAARHDVAIKNMRRLRALRLARDAKSKTNSSPA
jgi:phosphopantothenate synthetase